MEIGKAGSLVSIFAQRAEAPVTPVKKAEEFLTAVTSKAALSPQDIKTGRELMSAIDRETELYTFNAVQLNSLQGSAADIDKQVSEIDRALESAHTARSKLKAILPPG